MGDLLGTVSLADVGPWGLLVTVLAGLFVALQRGTLVTGKSHDEQMADLRETHATAIADRDRQIVDWRDAYRASDSRGDVLVEQVKELVIEHRTFNHFMESMREVVSRGGDT